MTNLDMKDYEDAMKYKPIYFAVMNNGEWRFISEEIFNVYDRDPWPEKIHELIIRRVPAKSWEQIVEEVNKLAKAEGISKIQALHKIAKKYEYDSDQFSSYTAKDWHDMGVRLKKSKSEYSS
jgi:hypothetical protein